MSREEFVEASWGFIFIVAILFCFSMAVYAGYQEYQDYKVYRDFCEERSNFCYCEMFSCEFRTTWSSQTGFSKETLELCELAKELNDKSMIFKTGCEE